VIDARAPGLTVPFAMIESVSPLSSFVVARTACREFSSSAHCPGLDVL
jgi:hypothetical protein